MYTKTLGWEVRADVTIEAWRLPAAIGRPGRQSDMGVVLTPSPEPLMLDGQSSAALVDLVAKGAGGTLFLETDDGQASYEELTA